MTTRRNFFQLVAGAALLPVMTKANVPYLWGDGIHDDTEALRSLLRGEVVEFAPGITTAGCGWNGNTLTMPGGQFRLTSTLTLGPEFSEKCLTGGAL